MKKKYIIVSFACISLMVAGCAKQNQPKVNKYLASETYAITHFNPAQTDNTPYPFPKGNFEKDLSKEQMVYGGPINIITLASTCKNYMWGMNSQGVTYIDVKNGNFKEVARLNAPGVREINEELSKKVLNKKYKNTAEIERAVKNLWKLDQTRIQNGVYSVVDKDNNVYVSMAGNQVYAFGLIDKKNPSKGIEIKGNYTAKHLTGWETITGLSMTYDGKLIILGNMSLTVIDRDFTNQSNILKFKGEIISNSSSNDEKGGIYFASDKYMRKVVWTGTELTEDENLGAWKSTYDMGQQPPAVKFGTGTGSTPTLMGFGKDEDKLVVLTDGKNRMSLVAFWRDEIPADFVQKKGTKSRRIADQINVTAGHNKNKKWIQSEQSIVVKGYGAFVVNNVVEIKETDRLVDVLALGPIKPSPYGVERFQWNTVENKWESVWTRIDVSSVSMVPAVSTKSNMVMVNGYDKKGWNLVGLDWDTGETVHYTTFGNDNYGNGAYAIIQNFPNGDVLLNSIGGPIRIRY